MKIGGAAAIVMSMSISFFGVALAEEAPPKSKTETLTSANPGKRTTKPSPKDAAETAAIDARSAATLAKAIEAIRANPRILDETFARKALPAGWTLETKGLPSGVAGMALGPAAKNGRAVLVLSRAAPLPPASAWEGDEARAFLERTLATAEGGVAITAIVREGVLGGPEVFAEKRAVEGEPVLVRHAFTVEPAGWMLTIIAPAAQFAPIYERISDAFAGGGKKATLGSAQKL